jgi:hypothetical protein
MTAATTSEAEVEFVGTVNGVLLEVQLRVKKERSNMDLRAIPELFDFSPAV